MSTQTESAAIPTLPTFAWTMLKANDRTLILDGKGAVIGGSAFPSDCAAIVNAHNADLTAALASTPALPVPGAILTWQKRVDSDYLSNWDKYEQNPAEVAMLAEIADLCAALAAVPMKGEPAAWAVESNIGTGVRAFVKFCVEESEADRFANRHQAEFSGAERVKVPLYRAAPVVPVDRNAVLEEAAIACEQEDVAPTDNPNGVQECIAAAIRALKSAVLAAPQPAVPQGQAKALHAAVAALYFDDSSDFRTALCNVVRLLDKNLAFELLTNPKVAYDKACAMLAAAPEVGLALPAAQGEALTEDEQLALMVKVEDYMGAVDWAGTQIHEKCDAAEAAIFAKVDEFIKRRATPVQQADTQSQKADK